MEEHQCSEVGDKKARYGIVPGESLQEIMPAFQKGGSSEDGEVGVDPKANFEVESLGQDSFCVEFEQQIGLVPSFPIW